MDFRVSIYLLVVVALVATTSKASREVLSPYYYDQLCPEALPTIKRIVEEAISIERRMGASLLRLHFHDCFVNGCDASILLDSSPTIDGEKIATATGNSSTRGFEVIDRIKYEVDQICGASIVSCADIVAVAARDSVVALGGPFWDVRLGRRDSTNTSRELAEQSLPTPFMNLSALITVFNNQGLDEKDLVVLSGAHTLGFTHCFLVRKRIYNGTNIDPAFARQQTWTCPATRGQGDFILAPLDPTPASFDLEFYKNLLKRKTLLSSDQELYNGGPLDGLVKFYSKNGLAFFKDFAQSMIKMGNIKPLTGDQGEIRNNCRIVN